MPATGYILDTVTQERWDMQLNPEGLELALGAEYASKTPRGASTPRRSFTAGRGRSFTLELVFLRRTEDASDIDEWRKRIESLPFPDYDASGQLVREPHPIRVAFGPWRSLRCTVDSVRVGYGPYFLPATLAPAAMKATLELVEAPLEGSLGRDDVRGGL